jgi:hypothetical protein
VAAQAASAAAAAGSAAEAAAGVVAGAASAPPPAKAAPAATAPRAPASAAATAGGPAAAASTPALCVRASDGSSFCADTLQLVFKTVTLPSGRRGNAYGPRLLVQGGTPPYDLGLAGGKLPPGMELSDDGHLGGVPTATGLHHFTLAVRDASTPPLSVQQRYALRINAPRPPPAAAPASAPDPAPPTLTAVGKKDAEAVASLLSQTHLRAYKLTADDLKKLATPPEPPEPPAAEPAAPDPALPDVDLTAAPPPAAAASAPPPEPRPTPDQLKDMLTPLLDVEYPTRTLFETALEARRCAYFKLLVSEAARKQGLASVPGCPLDPLPPADAAAMAAASAPARGRTAPTAAAPASPLPMPSLAPALGTTATAAAGAFNKVSASLATGTAAGTRLLGSSSSAAAPPAPPAAPPDKAAAADGEIPLDRLYAMLLPDGLKTEIVTTAQKLHDSTLAKPVHWTGDGCGCTPPVGPGGNDVYGFYPFWMAQDEKQAIDFSLFTRIGYFGPVLDDSGDYSMPPHWNDPRRDFIRTAHRHDVDVDLVIYRRDWPRVLNMGTQQQQTFIRKATARAVALADTPLTDRTSLRGYLLPVWSERTHVYSGITVFFDDLPTEPAQADQFRSFFRRFMDELIKAMQQTGRSYALSIVVPDHLLGDEAGAYNFSDLLGYIARAESGTRSPTRGGTEKSADAIDRVDYKGTTDISVLLLVLLSEPTSDTKKVMRARMDNTNSMHGHQRVAFLNSILPVMFHPVSDPAAPLPKPRKDRLDIDLAYVEWQFGGVAFWPMPLKPADPAMASVTGVLVKNEFLGPVNSTLSPLCTRVCPNRSIVRLLFEVLLLVGVVSLGAYAWVCEVRRLGMKFMLFLWGGGVVTLLVGMALLSCDPDLVALRRGNYLLYALILALTAGGLYVTFKPRVDPP